ncbi:iron-binding protein [Candidatus Roizmanbacteria bacterium CG_4_10_14_0_8_um_filter_33_9]|uniref:Iron-binding protein n=1 Tax=Candidatus Roizmanbacteria bacterium CG_4_10_14_0_8_um_filter_33_9 TaxID=1974826 RepID=A0A2M7QGY5_9BACT|nr:MAG: iron-binding protein [Candidatus Roizmanbacteria bacterium CG_4_10_14_0_8_um_filter_33_9]
MARVVIKEAKGPMELKPQKKSVFICMCGLSKNQPFCDGSHLKTKDEKKGEVYRYNEKGEKMDCCDEKDSCCSEKGEECCCKDK